MTGFYTNVQTWGNNILVRGVSERGKRFSRKEKFSPTLFVPSEKKTGWNDLWGEPLKPVSFDTIKEAKAFLLKNDEDYPIYGNAGFQYQYIAENYQDHIEFDKDRILAVGLDIETSNNYGFPSVENPIEEILLITLRDKVTGETVTFGKGPFTGEKTTRIDKSKLTYIECTDEKSLIQAFLSFWADKEVDIVTGWNITIFDIPYLISRITRVFGADEAKRLSPWGNITERKVYRFGRENTVYNLYGIAILDYLDLYQKFVPARRESYSLNYIAKFELGEEKLEHGYETYKDFYEQDWERFVEYNIIDVDLVMRLDNKLNFLALVITLAYIARCNFQDIFSPVRTWDSLLYNHMRERYTAARIPETIAEHDVSIAGGYVKEPVPGRYDWVVSFDAASLYPSIIMQYNVSPEKIDDFRKDIPIVRLANGHVLMPELLNREIDMGDLVDRDLATTPDGYCYRRDSEGLFPEVIRSTVALRNETKKKMLEMMKEKNDSPEHKTAISTLKVKQEAIKILNNSLYGSLSSKYFRFFDLRLAESITLTGQMVIQWVGQGVNTYLNHVLKTEGIDYVFYSDTDSIYITLKGMVQEHFSEEEKRTIIRGIDRFCEQHIRPFIEKDLEELFVYTNAFQRKLEFKREAIAEGGIWAAKKRYALLMNNHEGVVHDPPIVKVTGLETNRSDVPDFVRKRLKDALVICLGGTEQDLQKFVKETKEQFMKMRAEDVAFPKGVNGLTKYASSSSIYLKGTPMHTRAALLYNAWLEKLSLTHKYPPIQDGSKIKFVQLQEPNSLGENAIGFPTSLPDEFGVREDVNHLLMFEKAFMKPLNTIVGHIGWKARRTASLESLFNL